MNAKFRSSQATEKIDEALSKAQRKIEPATKDATNPHFKSRFASLNSIFSALREPLSEAGIAILQAATSDGDVVTVTTRLSHAGQFYEADLSVKPTQPGPQGLGSVVSYLKRYGLAALAGVPVGDDDDGEAAEGRDAPRTNGKASDAVRAAAAKQVGNARPVPQTPEARKSDLKSRMKAMGIEGAKMAEQLGEWIGRVVDGTTVFTADDWSRADTAIEQAKNGGEALAKARANVAAAEATFNGN